MQYHIFFLFVRKAYAIYLIFENLQGFLVLNTIGESAALPVIISNACSACPKPM